MYKVRTKQSYFYSKNKMKTTRFLFIIVACCMMVIQFHAQNKIVVFQSDFGLKDGAVSAMKGVAISVSPDRKLFDLTHEIPTFNI